MRQWLRGESSEAPYWALVLVAAAEWGVAPWVIESDVTAEWWGRWTAWREERAAANGKKWKK